MKKKTILVEKDRKTLDLLQDFGFSYSDSNKILRNKDLKINGKPAKPNDVARAGDEAVVYFQEDMISKRFEVVFESENVVIVYKKRDIETAGPTGIEGFLGIRAVHRLDRNTEGLVAFAKTEAAEKTLLDAFKNHNVHKFYIAEVVGKMDETRTYKAYLLKDKEKSKVEIFPSPRKDAVEISTKIKPIKPGEQSSLVEIELLTGKTHQIRAHLAYLGHPIIGDGKYGRERDNKKFNQNKQKLCCFKLIFDKIGLEELDGKTFQKNPDWQNF